MTLAGVKEHLHKLVFEEAHVLHIIAFMLGVFAAVIVCGDLFMMLGATLLAVMAYHGMAFAFMLLALIVLVVIEIKPKEEEKH